MSDDLRARLAVFARLMEAEWHNGNMPESTYLRLNADLGGLVAAYAPPSDPAAPMRDAVAALRPTHPIYRDKGLYMSGFAEARTAALAAINAAPPSDPAAHPDDDFVARAQAYREEHEATHEDEMCGGPCIVLGLAGDDEPSDGTIARYRAAHPYAAPLVVVPG